jgi:proline dehydrogenase
MSAKECGLMIIRNFIFWLSTKKKLTDAIGRRGMKYGFAKRFVSGESLEEAIAACQELNEQGRRISLNHLGENVHTEKEAVGVKDGYVEMVREIVNRKVDGNISIKLTQLGLDISKNFCQQLADEIAGTAKGLGQTIEVDMEASPYTDATLDIFENARRRFDNVALAVQAYLYRTTKDLERLAPLKPKIRLVKGAYREPKNLAYQKKSDVDANYCRLLDQLLDGPYFPAIATHDPKMLDYAREGLKKRGLAPEKYEFQMIYGVRRDLQQQLRDQGHPLRIYVPFGTEWCPYFMRRLSERPANCWFIVKNLLVEGSR